MSHIYDAVVTHMNESCEVVMSQIWISHVVIHAHKSCHTCEVNESCHTCEVNESCHTCEVNESCHTCEVNESCHTSARVLSQCYVSKYHELCVWMSAVPPTIDSCHTCEESCHSATWSCPNMGWLRLVGSLKLYVSFAKEPYKRDYILPKRPIIFRSLLIVAAPYHELRVWMSAVPSTNDSCHTCERVTSHMWTSLVTRACVCVWHDLRVTRTTCLYQSHMSCHTYEWVIIHARTSCHT